MGLFKIKFTVSNLNKAKKAELEGYVDTGATYSLIPSEILESLGIKKSRQIIIRGICCEKKAWVGDALIAISVDDEIIEGVSSVVFGDDPNVILIGSHALEALGLEVDPINKRIRKATYVVMY